MNNNSDSKRLSREERKRGISETIPGRIPKKNRAGCDSNEGDGQREDGMISEKELSDPVAEARKALEMFEEVSGERVTHTIPNRTKEITQEKSIHGEEQNNKMEEERRKIIEVSKARQKKRIQDGEAKRRQFRPKIAGLQESNCLL